MPHSAANKSPVRRIGGWILFGATWLIGAPGMAAHSGKPCSAGFWADAMIGSYHINPDRKFQDFDPGVGIECDVTPEWAVAAGYFRNSVPRPSFYGGGIYAPEYAHWGWFRLGVMGGVISGYNFGRFGVGSNHRTGPVLAPTAIVRAGRFGVNFILIPPIPADHVPVTIGFQAKYRFR